VKELPALRIHIPGHGEFWLQSGTLDEDGAVSPDHHCHDDGSLNLNTCFNGDSYAHYFPGRGVLRYNRQICTTEEIQIVCRTRGNGAAVTAEAIPRNDTDS
jgi:hypothetical protein